MNYEIMAELLSEGFKREQLIEEDWEALKKELAGLYVAGKITERQISTRLNKAGMGSLSKNAAYKIAHDPDNVQKRETNLQRVKDAEELKAKREAIAAQAAKHQTRGSAAQAYCDAWNKKFGHIVKAGVVREALENALENQGVIFEDSIVDDYFVNLFEEVNSIGETKMTEEKLTKIFEETLEEAFSADKLKKHLKRGAIALGATAALAGAPGVVSGAKNVKAQSDARKQAAQEYQMSKDEINARQNEVAKKIHDTGVEAKNNVAGTTEMLKAYQDYFNEKIDDKEFEKRARAQIEKYGLETAKENYNRAAKMYAATEATKIKAKEILEVAAKAAKAAKGKATNAAKTAKEKVKNYFPY